MEQLIGDWWLVRVSSEWDIHINPVIRRIELGNIETETTSIIDYTETGELKPVKIYWLADYTKCDSQKHCEAHEYMAKLVLKEYQEGLREQDKTE